MASLIPNSVIPAPIASPIYFFDVLRENFVFLNFDLKSCLITGLDWFFFQTFLSLFISQGVKRLLTGLTSWETEVLKMGSGERRGWWFPKYLTLEPPSTEQRNGFVKKWLFKKTLITFKIYFYFLKESIKKCIRCRAMLSFLQGPLNFFCFSKFQ